MPNFIMGMGIGLRYGLGLGEFVPPTPSVPVNVGLPTLTGPAQVGGSLFFGRGSWSGYPSPTYVYQLKRNGVNIAGSSPYTILQADDGSDLTLEVTATNSAGSDVATSAAVSVVVAGLSPTNTTAPVVSGSNGLGDTLTATNGAWSGTPASFTYERRFTRNGSPIAGATGSTYAIVAADSGAAVRAEVRATNTEGTSAWEPSNAITVQTFAAASITGTPTVGGTAEVGQTLTATASTVSGNPTPARSWEWLRDGVVIAGATASTYALVSADAGVNIAARQTEANALGSPAVATSAAVSVAALVVPAAPTNATAPVVSGSNGLGDTLTATNGTWSGTPASFTYERRFTRNGSPIAGATGSTYAIVAADSGAAVRAEVRATNTEGTSAWEPSNAITVQTFAAASITGTPTVGGTAEVGQTLTATAATVSGNPTPTRSWEWLRDGVVIAGATASTYALVEADLGANIAPRQTEANALGSPAVATGTAVGPVAAASATPVGELTMDDEILSMDDATLSMEA